MEQKTNPQQTNPKAPIRHALHLFFSHTCCFRNPWYLVSTTHTRMCTWAKWTGTSMITAKVWYIKALCLARGSDTHKSWCLAKTTRGFWPLAARLLHPRWPGDLSKDGLNGPEKGEKEMEKDWVWFGQSTVQIPCSGQAWPHKLGMRREKHLPAERSVCVTVVQNEWLSCQEHPSHHSVHKSNLHLCQA